MSSRHPSTLETDMGPTPYEDTTPLGSGTFRIVRISPGQWSEPMRCSLLRCHLDYLSSIYGEYRALSYAWGAQGVKTIIYVNNYQVGVTLNLSCALRYLRRKDEDITLWVDALVCLQYLPTGLPLSTSRAPFNLSTVCLNDLSRPNSHSVHQPERQCGARSASPLDARDIPERKRNHRVYGGRPKSQNSAAKLEASTCLA